MSERHKRLTNSIALFIAKDLQPMSAVDGVGFQELMAVAEPRYTIPSHTFFSQTMLPAKYAELFAKVQSVLTIVPYFSITTNVVIQISVKRIRYCHMSCD